MIAAPWRRLGATVAKGTNGTCKFERSVQCTGATMKKAVRGRARASRSCIGKACGPFGDAVMV